MGEREGVKIGRVGDKFSRGGVHFQRRGRSAFEMNVKIQTYCFSCFRFF